MEAKIKVRASVTFKVDCTLTEGDLRALDAIAGYGTKAFLEVFYKHLGKAYLEPWEDDVVKLFEKVRSLRPAIQDIKDYRKTHNLQDKGY